MAQNDAEKERYANQRGHNAHRHDHARHDILRDHRGDRQHQRADQRTGRQIKPVILTKHQAGDVRGDQADKADRSDKRHRQRRQNADAQQGGQPQTAHVDAKTHRPIFP